MANAKQCDRCGKFYTVSAWDDACSSIRLACVTLGVAQSNVLTIMDKITEAVDLCPKCQDSLKNWILEKETNDEND